MRQQAVTPATASRASAPQGVAPKPDPRLDAVLKRWEMASKQINKLEGSHERHVYDMVFKVEKVSKGHFYHEVPDKGRIDIEPIARIPKGAESNRKDPRTGKPFDLISDMQEKWICDGKRIIEINEQEKTANVIAIPPRGQGENIMNGPLPFLFGMEAEVAKKRYQMQLVYDRVNPKTQQREIQIKAYPRWQGDMKNWKEARIILQPNFLPLHVKLIDPANTKETVFSFANMKVETKQMAAKKKNALFKFPGTWGKNPFRPNLAKYKVNTSVKGSSPSKPTISLKSDEVLIPAITGYTPADAKQRLEQAGLTVHKRWTRGGAPPMKNMELKIRTSIPRPMTVVKKGATVKLVVYERQVQTAGATK